MNRLVRSLLLLTLPLLASCSSLYFPPPPQAPLLTQKGEFSGGIHTNFSNNLSLQGAYAITSGLGAMGSASFLHTSSSRKDVDHNFGELGLGYFTRLGDRRVLEVYGGIGSGTTRRTERTREGLTSRTLEGNLTKFFAQVNYSSKDNHTIHALGHDFPITYGTALRLSYLTLDNFRLDGVPHAVEENVFLEPITFTRINLLGPLQFQFISGANIGLRQRQFLKASNAVLNFGLVLNLGGQEGRK